MYHPPNINKWESEVCSQSLGSVFGSKKHTNQVAWNKPNSKVDVSPHQNLTTHSYIFTVPQCSRKCFSRELPEIEIEQDVRVTTWEKNRTWKMGTCFEKLSNRFCVVKTNSDIQIFRRNRFPSQLKSLKFSHQTMATAYRQHYQNKGSCLCHRLLKISREHKPQS